MVNVAREYDSSDDWSWLPDEATSVHEAAQAYSAHGLRPLPVCVPATDDGCIPHGPDCAHPGKRPVGAAWQSRAIDLRPSEWRSRNIGLQAGGALRLVVLDVDGEAGRATLAALEREHGPLPPTLSSASGRAEGGAHLFFVVPAGLDMPGDGGNSTGKLGPGLDTKGENGQVVVAPSIHQSCRRYRWTARRAPAPMPLWLWTALNAGAAKVEREPTTTERTTRLDERTRRYVANALALAMERVRAAGEGQRNYVLNAEAYSVFGYCKAGMLSEAMARAGLADAAQDAGLDDGEIGKTLDSAWTAAQSKGVPPLHEERHDERQQHSEAHDERTAPSTTDSGIYDPDALEREVRDEPPGIGTGWRTLDDLDLRFRPGELTLVGARTSHGKTTVLTGLLYNWLQLDRDPGSDDEGAPVIVVYTLEESIRRIHLRMLARRAADEGARWSVNQVRDYLRDPSACKDPRGWPDVAPLAEAQRWARAVASRVRMIHCPAWTAEQIGADLRARAARRPILAATVDYLQRIPMDGAERRDLDVSKTCGLLREAAEVARCPVVAGAQIGRGAAMRAEGAASIPPGAFDDPAVRAALATRRPQLHQLREGGSEQFADVVLGVFYPAHDFAGDPERKDSVPPRTVLELALLKDRGAEVGRWVELAFEPRAGLLADRALAEKAEAERARAAARSSRRRGNGRRAPIPDDPPDDEGGFRA